MKKLKQIDEQERISLKAIFAHDNQRQKMRQKDAPRVNEWVLNDGLFKLLAPWGKEPIESTANKIKFKTNDMQKMRKQLLNQWFTTRYPAPGFLNKNITEQTVKVEAVDVGGIIRILDNSFFSMANNPEQREKMRKNALVLDFVSPNKINWQQLFEKCSQTQVVINKNLVVLQSVHRGNNYEKIYNLFWIKMFLLATQGGSVFKEQTNGLLTKKQTHTLLTSPKNADPDTVLIDAIARSSGASIGSAWRVAQSERLKRLNLFHPFVKSLIEYFASIEKDIKVNQIDDAVDYILAHRHPSSEHFKHISWEQLKKREYDWHRQLAREKDWDKYAQKWKPVPIKDWSMEQTTAQGKVQWFMTQLTTGKALADEGNQLRHCVSGYQHSCKSGHCSIWSLSRTNEFGAHKKVLTIELSKSYQMIQIRGLANRLARPDEMRVLREWESKRELVDEVKIESQVEKPERKFLF